MKILIVHNFYQISGGEDAVYENEVKLLFNNDIEVTTVTVNNDGINSFFSKIKVIFGTVFNPFRLFTFINILNSSKPDVVHVHNFFPLLSPSIFWACKIKKIPVVHTLHNFRIVCPTATLMFDGSIEENSVKKNSFWAIKKRVYRDSLVGTFVLVMMIELNKRIGTWSNATTKLIALTEFAKNKYIESGIPSSKLVIKPNFVEHDTSPNFEKHNYAIFVGRLSEDKGIQKLIEAWSDIDYPLVIVGDGPEKELVVNSGNENIIYKGKLGKSEVLDLVSKARFLIMASTWYEGLPMVLIEALSVATPCLVPNLGGMAAVIEDGTNGLHFEPNNIKDMRNKIDILRQDDALLRELSKGAYTDYVQKYRADTNFQLLMDIYEEAIKDLGANGK
jgi:glycosyltransferase involved in cell wall biosynthesis